MSRLPLAAAWEALGPFGGPAEAIVVSPGRPSTLLAASRNALLFRSSDSGAHWSVLPFEDSLTFSVRVLRAIEGEHTSYYLGGIPAGPGEPGLFRSDDEGDSWKPVAGLEGKSVFSLAFWGTEARMILAGCHDGLYRSVDGGMSWSLITPPNDMKLRPVTSLAIDPRSSDVIYAGTTHLPWKTEDGGQTWTSIHHGMLDDSDVFSIEIDPAEPDRVFASACSGIYFSADAGGEWTKLLGVPNTSRRTYIIRQDPLNAQIVYAGTNQGLWKSTDAGANWTQLWDSVTKSIAFHPDNGEMYLATEDGGLLASRDGGHTMRPINAGFVNRTLRQLAEVGDEFYAASPYGGTGENLYRLSSGGQWIALRPGPGRPPNLLSVISAGAETLLGITQDGVVRSADGGKTWLALSGWRGRVRSVASPASPLLFLGTSEGLYRSLDLGSHWTLVERMPVEGVYAGRGRVVIESGNRLLISNDEGHNWTHTASPASSGGLYGVAIGAGGIMLAATSSGAFRSEDGGATWTLIADLADGTVRGVAFDEAGGAAVAIRQGVVYQSEDAGLTWDALDMTGMEGALIVSLTIPAAPPSRIFAATQARGVFVSILPERDLNVSQAQDTGPSNEPQ